MNNSEEISLVGATLDAVLVVLYGPEAPGKVRSAYELLRSREADQFNRGSAAGQQKAETEAKRIIADLEKERDTAKATRRMYEDAVRRAWDKPQQAVEKSLDQFAKVWTPGLTPMQMQPGQGRLDAAELQQMLQNG